MSNIFRITKEPESGKPTRYYSDLQEKAVAKSLGGKQTKNSGATPWQKGDVSGKNILYECKTKTKASDSINIKKEWLAKLKDEALFMGKPYETLVFNFGPNQENYYIINEQLFKILLENLEGDI